MANHTSKGGILYRFFSAFSVFDGTLPLGYEAPPSPRIQNGANGTQADEGTPNGYGIFSMDDAFGRVRSYMNGGSLEHGVCIVTLVMRDHDADTKMKIGAIFSALCDYVTAAGIFTDEESGTAYRVYTAGAPLRKHISADGAAWEMKFSYEEYKI